MDTCRKPPIKGLRDVFTVRRSTPYWFSYMGGGGEGSPASLTRLDSFFLLIVQSFTLQEDLETQILELICRKQIRACVCRNQYFGLGRCWTVYQPQQEEINLVRDPTLVFSNLTR